MALTLDDLAARVEALTARAEDLTRENAQLEQELVALRAAVAARPRTVPDTAGRPATEAPGPRRLRPRPLTRLGLFGAAAAAGAAVLPAAAQAASPQTHPHKLFVSPNGLFSLDVTNVGIFLQGPGGRIEVLGSQVLIQGSGVANIQAPLLHLNSGGRPVARLGDQVQVTVATSSGPATGTGTIITGSPTVVAG